MMRKRADKAEVEFCPFCGELGTVKRWEAVLKCGSCERAFLVIHTSSGINTATQKKIPIENPLEVLT